MKSSVRSAAAMIISPLRAATTLPLMVTLTAFGSTTGSGAVVFESTVVMTMPTPLVELKLQLQELRCA